MFSAIGSLDNSIKRELGPINVYKPIISTSNLKFVNAVFFRVVVYSKARLQPSPATGSLDSIRLISSRLFQGDTPSAGNNKSRERSQ